MDTDTDTDTNTAHAGDRPLDPSGGHLVIEPSILYFGTPVVLLSTENGDGSPNLAPISSAWALGPGPRARPRTGF